ncbi:MAG: hypothetical protein AB8B96_22420 [Lysobacterales bacterium]
MEQYDQLAPISGVCRVGLFDDRPGSVTEGASMAFEISAAAPVILCIPPMVWHGFGAAGNMPNMLVQHNNRAFVDENPDEELREHESFRIRARLCGI